VIMSEMGERQSSIVARDALAAQVASLVEQETLLRSLSGTSPSSTAQNPPTAPWPALE